MQLEWLPALCRPRIRSVACGIKMDPCGFNPGLMIYSSRWQTNWIIFKSKDVKLNSIFQILVPNSLFCWVFAKTWDQINILFMIFPDLWSLCFSLHRGAHLSMQDLLGSWDALDWLQAAIVAEMIDEYRWIWFAWRILKMWGVIVNSYNKRLDGSYY